jgi:tape measure domain-containing protein
MANEFIEIISEQTKKQINDIMPLVKELADQIKTINNFKPANTPSGADNKQKEYNSTLEQTRAKLALIASLNKQRYEQEAKLIADNDKALTYKSDKELKQMRDKQAMIASLNKQKNEEIAQAQKAALANEKLNRAYVQLTANREKAKNKLQDLIASEKASNAEIRKAQQEFDVLNKKVAAADKAVGRFSDANRKINGLATSVGNLMTAFGVGTGIYLAIDIAKNIYETTKALQSLDLALKMVSGTQDEFASNQAFVTATAEKWGVEIKTLTEQYTYFYTAAKGLMSTAEIKTTFEGIAKAGAVMGLSLEKQSAAFYAFEQMMSKGIVTSEELKKQLGNSMPGAIRAAAMAYMDLHPAIKTIQEAEKMLLVEMKRGAIDSATYVPLIVKNLEKLYGIEMVDKVETLQAAQNRLKNSWTDLVRSMNESKTGGLSVFLGALAGGLKVALDYLTRYNTEWKKLHGTAREEGKIVGADFYTTKGKSKEKLKEDFDFMYAGSVKIAAKITELNKKFAKEGFFSEINPFSNTGEDIEKLNQELGQLEGAMKKINSVLNPQEVKKKPAVVETEAQRKAREKAEKERLDAIEKSAKIDYDLALSNAERKKELIEDELDTFKGSIEQKIQLSMKLALAENDINKIKLKEAKRQSNGDGRLIGIAENVEFKAQGDVLQSNQKRVVSFYKDFYKEMSDAVGDKTFTATGMWTKEQLKEAEEADRVRLEELKKTQKAISDAFNMFAGDFADKMGFTDTFDFLLGEDKDGNTLFDRLKTDEDHWKDYALAVTTVMQDMYNFLNQQSQARFEAEYKRLEDQKTVALQFAGDSTTAKAKIEEDYEKKHKQIQQREAKAKKQQAMFNIAMDTAQAVMATLGKGGFFASPLAIAVAAMGAIQLAMVAAQKVPQYWRGTDNAEAGLAWTNERGAELVTDKEGHIKDFGTNKGAKLTMMEKGDKVYTAQQTKKMMFDDNLNSILTDNGIGNAPKVVVNSGMSKSDMKEALMETLGAMPMQSTIIDKNGLQHIITNGHSKTIFLSNRVSGVGLKV